MNSQKDVKLEEVFALAAMSHLEARNQNRQLVFCNDDVNIVFAFRDRSDGGVDLLSNVDLQDSIKPPSSSEDHEALLESQIKPSSPSLSEESFPRQHKTLLEHFNEKRWRKRSLDHTSVTNGHSFRGMVYYGVEPLWATQRYEQDKKRFKS